jgi:hypothetical protein
LNRIGPGSASPKRGNRTLINTPEERNVLHYTVRGRKTHRFAVLPIGYPGACPVAPEREAEAVTQDIMPQID